MQSCHLPRRHLQHATPPGTLPTPDLCQLHYAALPPAVRSLLPLTEALLHREPELVAQLSPILGGCGMVLVRRQGIGVHMQCPELVAQLNLVMGG